MFNGTADREGLIRYLQRRCGVSEARARMIADDQIAKASERMRVEKWRSQGKDYVRWVHGGESDPRDYHLRDWDGISGIDETGERGYPAQLINCHCYLEPITAKEFDVIAGEMAAQAEADYLAEVMRERGLPQIQFTANHPAA